MLVVKSEVTKYIIESDIIEFEGMLRFLISGTKELIPGTPSSKYFIKNEEGQSLDFKTRTLCIIRKRRSSLGHRFIYSEIEKGKVELVSNYSAEVSTTSFYIVGGLVCFVIGLGSKSLITGIVSFVSFFFLTCIGAYIEFYFSRSMFKEMEVSYIHMLKQYLKA
jgi:hypothetical protein